MFLGGADKRQLSGIKIVMHLFILSLVFLCSSVAWGGAVEEWVRLYDGGMKKYDSAKAIAVDGQGNIYVTGSSVGDGNEQDYATIKYSPQGQKLWVRRYNGTGNSWDIPAGIALDGKGNVYVTGSSGGIQNYEYATIKYSPEGQEMWVRPYEGPANNGAFASAICVDLQGNVYVTGRSKPADWNGSDYATIKYDTNGTLLWEARYDGAGNTEGLNDGDYTVAVALDGQGNVYVTGTSIGFWTGYDYATIKYSPDGQQLWVKRYNGPGTDFDHARAMAVDSQGNVYVTGYTTRSGTGDDWLTIKYNTDGQKLWSKFFAGPPIYADDWPRAIAVDLQGNVFVTGPSKRPGAKYSEYITIKYRADGRKLWARRYTWERKGDYPQAMAVDAKGNVYVTGHSFGSKTGYAYATVKYDPDGRRLWTRRYSDDGTNYPCAIVVDGQGNVHVTGETYLSEAFHTDFCTIKYRQDDRRITDPY